jgi:hypothetical protein
MVMRVWARRYHDLAPMPFSYAAAISMVAGPS